MRSFSSSEKQVAALTSNNRVTFVSTLLTCCPPRPPLREVWNDTNGRNISAVSGLIGIIRIGLLPIQSVAAQCKPAHQHSRYGVSCSIQQRCDGIYERTDNHDSGNGFRRQSDRKSTRLN